MRLVFLFAAIALANPWHTALGASAEVAGDLADPKVYGYHTDSSLALGKTFSPEDITDVKFPCIESEYQSIDAGPPSTSLVMTFVENTSQLSQASKEEMKANLSLQKIKASASQTTTSSLLEDKTSITLVLTATTDFGRWSLTPSAKLAAAAQAALPDAMNFEKLCGSRYVAIERRGASAYAAITISNVSTNFKNAVTSNAKFGMGVPSLGAEASSLVNDEIRRAYKQNRLRTSANGNGGGGLGALRGVISGAGAKANPISEMASGLAEYVGSFTKDNAAPYAYTVASLKQFGWDPKEPTEWTVEQEKNLGTMREVIRSYARQIDGWQDYQSHGIFYKLYGPSRENQAAEALKQLEAAMDAWSRAFEACKAGKDRADCYLPDAAAGSGNDFQLPAPPLARFRLAAYNAQGLLDSFEGDRANLILARERSYLAHLGPERMQQVKLLSPAASGYNAFLQVSGEALELMSLVYVDDDGTELPITAFTPVEASGGSFNWARHDDWCCSEFAMRRVMSDNASEGDHQGTVYVVVKDRLARTFRIAAVDLKWNRFCARGPGTRDHPPWEICYAVNIVGNYIY